jgi:hypothetical protein
MRLRGYSTCAVLDQQRANGKEERMGARRSRLVLVTLVAVAVVVTIPPLRPPIAHATPGFARQTGLSCQACHTVFPELTPFGRKFKLNAYVFTNVKQLTPVSEQGRRTLALSDLPPLSLQLQGSNTWMSKAVPDSNPEVQSLAEQNTTQFPQALSLFYTGKIADELGAFLQLTWNPPTNAVGIDNSDLRFANHGSFESIGLTDFIYGATLNNNPTSQDVWNSTPAWGYPFIVTNVGVPPAGKALLDGQLAQESAGLAPYLFLFDHLYLEAGAYRSAQTSFTNETTGGPGPLDSTAPLMRISGPAAPYWRAAWEQDWGNNALSFGTYGIWAPTHPSGVGESGPRNYFTDIGIDGQYQYITDNHIVSLAGTWIHELRKFNNTSLASNPSDTLNTVRFTGSYFFRRFIGGSVQFFSTSGSSDPVMYGSGTAVLGSASGNPATRGATVELDVLPWLNTKLGVQYTAYGKFNGSSNNYDGFGRNASNNNVVYIFIWTAF